MDVDEDGSTSGGPRESQAECDKDAACGSLHDCAASPWRAELAGGAAAEQGDEQVHDGAGGVEEQAEQYDLQCWVATRGIDELRQESEEEERNLRVEHVGDDALAKDCPERR